MTGLVEGVKPAYLEVAEALDRVTRKDIPPQDLQVVGGNADLLRKTQKGLSDFYRMYRDAFRGRLTPIGAPRGDFKSPEDRAIAAVNDNVFGGSHSEGIHPFLTEPHDANGERVKDPHKVAADTAGHILSELGLILPARGGESVKDRILARAAIITEPVEPIERVIASGQMRVPNPETGETVYVYGPTKRGMTLELRDMRLGSLVSVLVGLGVERESSDEVWIKMQVGRADLKDPKKAADLRKLIAAD